MVRGRVYWAPKLGNQVAEWEDACAFDEARLRFAVADGASSSYLAQDWARALAEGFVASPPRTFDREAVESWVEGISSSWGEDHDAAGESEWYVDEASARGSFATLLGLELRPLGDCLRWRAMAIGDCCLFHIQGHELSQAFPLQSSESFGSTPDLVSSVAYRGGRGADSVTSVTGDARAGEILLLVSDALAEWALRRADDGSDVWRVLSTIAWPAFSSLVDELRQRGEMENDDVTMLRCEVVA